MERVWDGWCSVQEEVGEWKISYWGHGEKGNNLSSVRKWQGRRVLWPLPKERLWNGNLQISLTSQSGTNKQHFGPFHMWWQLSVLGEHNPGHLQYPHVWQLWVTCLLKDLSFSCCTPVYLFQGRAASFKLPGKIKLYYSPNMTRGWQAPVWVQSGTQPSGTGNMFLLPAGEERIDPRAPRCTRRMSKQGLISTAWCKTWASPPRAKSQRGVLGLSGVTAQAEQGTLWCWGGWGSSRGTDLGFLIFALLSASGLTTNKCNSV